MMPLNSNQNIVQAEFFHVDTRGTSISTFFGELRERIENGARIKTVIRFYDEGGFMTELIQHTAQIETRRQALLQRVFTTKGWRRRWLNFRYGLVLGDVSSTKEELKNLTTTHLHAIAKAQGEIAIENEDHSFRPMQENEIYETLIAIDRATGVWFFLFEQNDLLADENTLIASVM